jgi:glutamyl-tRNA synthetase
LETLGQASDMIRFLFVEQVEVDPDDAAKILGADSGAAGVLAAAEQALVSVDSWTTESIEAALRTALIDGLGLKPKVAFGPVRLAVTGRRISPPLFESLELLGRESGIARIAALRGA